MNIPHQKKPREWNPPIMLEVTTNYQNFLTDYMNTLQQQKQLVWNQQFMHAATTKYLIF